MRKSPELTGVTHVGTHIESNPPMTWPEKTQSFPAFAKILSKYVRYAHPAVSPAGVLTGYESAPRLSIFPKKKKRDTRTKRAKRKRIKEKLLKYRKYTWRRIRGKSLIVIYHQCCYIESWIIIWYTFLCRIIGIICTEIIEVKYLCLCWSTFVDHDRTDWWRLERSPDCILRYDCSLDIELIRWNIPYS